MVNIQILLMKKTALAGKTWLLLYLCLVTATIALAFSNWVYDDPYITYRYAVNLAGGKGFVYNPGQALLSITSPLVVILLALGYSLGFEPHGLAIFLGAASLAVGALLIWQISLSMKTPAAGMVGLLFYPTFPLLLTTLGSETPLYLAFCLGAIAAYLKDHPGRSAALSALACLARPDGILVPFALLVHAFLNKRQFTWKAVFTFILTLTPWLLFSWYTFGSPIPLTLYAKQAQGTLAISKDFIGGFLALAQSYATQWQWLFKAILFLLGLIPLFLKAKSLTFLIAWTSLYFLGFTVLGVSAYFWYYAPLVPAFLIITGLGLESLIQKFRAASPKIRPYAHLAAFLLVSILMIADINSLLILRQKQDHRFGIYQAAGTWLQQNTPENALTAALEIGILGYYAQRPIIDFAGLLQPEIAQQLVGAQDYESAALFTAERYHPDYLVLHQGLYPQLENRLEEIACKPVHFLDGDDYNYPGMMTIMQCNLP